MRQLIGEKSPAAAVAQQLDDLVGKIEELQRNLITSRRSWSKGIGAAKLAQDMSQRSRRRVRGRVRVRVGTCRRKRRRTTRRLDGFGQLFTDRRGVDGLLAARVTPFGGKERARCA